MRKASNVFWGVLLLLGALTLIVSKMGYFEGVGFWSILLSIGLVAILVKGVIYRSWGSILFPLALLCIVNDRLLGIEAITPGPVLGAALLGTIGLNLLFPRKWHHGYKLLVGNEEWGECEFKESADAEGGQHVRIDASFNSGVKYISNDDLSEVKVDSSFCTLTLYLDNAVLHNGSASMKIDASFGTLELFVPAGWNVRINVSTSFAHASEIGSCNLQGENILVINGEVSFGELRVHYI